MRQHFVDVGERWICETESSQLIRPRMVWARHVVDQSIVMVASLASEEVPKSGPSHEAIFTAIEVTRENEASAGTWPPRSVHSRLSAVPREADDSQ